jgi:hypothetical protein
MRSMLKVVEPARVMSLALVAVICVALPVQAVDIMLTTSEKDGSKIWEGGGTIDLKGPVSLKVKNRRARSLDRYDEGEGSHQGRGGKDHHRAP